MFKPINASVRSVLNEQSVSNKVVAGVYFWKEIKELNCFMNTIQVEQECFKTLKDFQANPTKYRKGCGGPGVYVWGFSLEKTAYVTPSAVNLFFPYYVGKVEKANGCMYQRTQEHFGSLMGGNLSVFDIVSASKHNTPIGKVSKQYQEISKVAKLTCSVGVKLPDPQFSSLLHFPEGIHRMYQFTTDAAIRNQLDWMLEHFCITYFTVVDYNEFSIQELEKYIGSLIGYDRLITKPFSKPDLKVELVDSNGVTLFDINKQEDLFKHCLNGF